MNAAYVREVMSRGDGRYNVYLHGGAALPLGRARDLVNKRLAGMTRSVDAKRDSMQPAGATSAV